jgi:HrpA-like RNA helicase
MCCTPSQLPVSPRLGKMLLFAVLFRCLDPVLTVACAMSYRPPFMMPLNSSEKRTADAARLALAKGSRSDHLALLGAYNGFHEARARGGGQPGSAAEFAFCRANFLSPPALNMVTAMREQLVDELISSGALDCCATMDAELPHAPAGRTGARGGGGRGAFSASGRGVGRAADILAAASVNAGSTALVMCVSASVMRNTRQCQY